MRIFVLFFIIIITNKVNLFAQLTTELRQVKNDSVKNKQLPKPEIFSSGFIDVVNNGQVNASARLIKLYVGEPNKF